MEKLGNRTFVKECMDKQIELVSRLRWALDHDDGREALTVMAIIAVSPMIDLNEEVFLNTVELKGEHAEKALEILRVFKHIGKTARKRGLDMAREARAYAEEAARDLSWR